jgi:holo-[acyl-carrier protein] synthase
MILGHGIDIADLGRVGILLSTMKEDFLLGTFTPAERATPCLPEEYVTFFGGRLAAKEAVVKALGTGFTDNIAWRHVEILRSADGSPTVRLRGVVKKLAQKLGISRWIVSISHTETLAVASVLAVND